MDKEQKGNPSEGLEVKPQAKLPFLLTRMGLRRGELESAGRLQVELKLGGRLKSMETGILWAMGDAIAGVNCKSGRKIKQGRMRVWEAGIMMKHGGSTAKAGY